MRHDPGLARAIGAGAVPATRAIRRPNWGAIAALAVAAAAFAAVPGRFLFHLIGAI